MTATDPRWRDVDGVASTLLQSGSLRRHPTTLFCLRTWVGFLSSIGRWCLFIKGEVVGKDEQGRE
eukprot:7060110-Prorocentrum_lima.AAC.1